MAKESVEIRFGVVAVRKGYVTADQVIAALEIQITEDINEEKHRLLGEILLDQRLMTEIQIHDVVDSLKLLKQ